MVIPILIKTQCDVKGDFLKRANYKNIVNQRLKQGSKRQEKDKQKTRKRK